MTVTNNTEIPHRVKVRKPKREPRCSAAYIDSLETVVIFYPNAPWIETIDNLPVSELRIKPSPFSEATGLDMWDWIFSLIERRWLQFADASYAANALMPGPACKCRSADEFFAMFAGTLQHDGGVA